MFDKKNTMLLTIVAVATLLVAIVGATFAYFSLSVEGHAETTASVTTDSPGKIILDGGGEKLHLKVSAADMSLENAGTEGVKYYALADSDEDYEGMSTGPSIYSKGGEKSYPIATATLSDGGTNTKYDCVYTVKVKSETDLTANIKTGELMLTLTGDGISSEKNANVVDLSTLESTQVGEESPQTVYTKEINGMFTLNGPEDSATVQASLYLLNSKTVQQQDYLAGKEMNFSIEVTGGSCTLNATDVENP